MSIEGLLVPKYFTRHVKVIKTNVTDLHLGNPLKPEVRTWTARTGKSTLTLTFAP